MRLPKREDATTELKSAAFLQKDGAEVVRPIAAFLNTSGGTLWVGLHESNGTFTVEDVTNADEERVRLINRIVDTLEPAPTEHEVQVHVQLEGGKKLLRIDVSKGADGPYAVLRGRLGREYVSRFADRTRFMSREELRQKFGSGAQTSLGSDRNFRARLDREAAGLTVVIARTLTRRIDFHAAQLRDRIRSILVTPQTAGNRPLGWTFHSQHNELKTARQGALDFNGGDNLPRIQLEADGTMTFSSPLQRLLWSGGRGAIPEQSIHPFPLMELPVSALRIASKLYQVPEMSGDDDEQVLVGLAIVGIKGWSLAPHSPQSFMYQIGEPAVLAQGGLTASLATTLKLVLRRPDSIATRLLEDVYWEFGFEPEKMPVELDRDAGVLRLS